MRGALGLGGRVAVVNIASAVLVGPNNGVGDGPEATERGVTVGVAPMPGVELGVGVRVWVAVGRAVGTTCRAVAPQALITSDSKIRLSSRSFMQYLDGCNVKRAIPAPHVHKVHLCTHCNTKRTYACRLHNRLK